MDFIKDLIVKFWNFNLDLLKKIDSDDGPLMSFVSGIAGITGIVIFILLVFFTWRCQKKRQSRLEKEQKQEMADFEYRRRVRRDYLNGLNEENI